MPISIQEIIADLPQVAMLVGQIQANIAKLPATPGAVDFARCAGAAEDGPEMTLALLIDALIAQSKTTP